MIPRPSISALSSQQTDTAPRQQSAVTRNPPSLRRSLQENGWLLLLFKLVSVPWLRLRDTLLSRQLSAPGLRLGRSPRLLGLRHMRLGRNLNAGKDLWLEAITSYGGVSFNPILVIGDDCNLSDQVHIGCTNHVEIGDGLLCGSRVIISDHHHGNYAGATGTLQSSPDQRPAERPLSPQGSVHIGRNVWIGDGVAVLAGASIGSGAVIGANAVVTGEIPPRCIAVGAPARVIRVWNKEHERWVSPGDSAPQRPSVTPSNATTTP